MGGSTGNGVNTDNSLIVSIYNRELEKEILT